MFEAAGALLVLNFSFFQTNDQPQVDLSASNSMVNLYTCWDSASALCRLLTYAASDGDSQTPFDPSSRHTSICSDHPLEPLVGKLPLKRLIQTTV